MEFTEGKLFELRQILYNLKNELDLEHPKSQGQSSSPAELREREAQLKAAVGVAQLLLDSIEKTSKKLEKTIEKVQGKKMLVQRLTLSLENVKSELLSSGKKVIQLSNALTQAEDQLQRLKNENTRSRVFVF